MAPLAPRVPGEPLPAVLLRPAWEVRGEVHHAEAHRAFPVPKHGNFTLCVRVLRPPDMVGSGRILEAQNASGGWLFSAPGRVDFTSGKAPAPAPASTPVPAEGAAEGDEAPHEAAEAPTAGTTRVDDGSWHHVMVAIQGRTLRIFVDGHLDGEAKIQAPTAGDLIIGPSEEEGGFQLRDLQAYTEYLCESQAAGLASNSKALPCGLELTLLPEQVEAFWGQVATLGPSGRAEATKAFVSSVLNLHEGGFPDEVRRDLFADFMDFVQAASFTPRKAAVAFAIFQATVESMSRTSKVSSSGEPFLPSESFEEYSRLLTANTFAAAASGNSTEGEPAALGIFTLPEVRQFTDFVISALFEQFLLYRYFLVRTQELVVEFTELTVDRPQPPLDLNRGKLLEDLSPKLLVGIAPLGHWTVQRKTSAALVEGDATLLGKEAGSED